MKLMNFSIYSEIICYTNDNSKACNLIDTIVSSIILF